MTATAHRTPERGSAPGSALSSLLAGLRVLDCGGDRALTLAAGRLAYLGADVRSLPSGPGPDQQQLASEADVILAGRPVVEKMGRENLERGASLLVESDWEGFGGELSVQAATGMLSYLGELNGPPVRIGWDVVTWAQGVIASQAVLAACSQGRPLRPGRVRVPVLRTAATLISNQIIAHSSPDEWIGFAGYQWQSPEHGFRCADGWVEIIFFRNEAAWAEFCRRVGLPDLVSDPRFATYPARTNHKSELAEELAAVLSEMSVARVEDLVGDCGGMCAERVRFHDAVAQPQVIDNGMRAQGDAVGLTSPWTLCGERAAPPTLSNGPPTASDWTGRSAWRATKRESPERYVVRGPLSGITVADVTEGAQGPFAVSLLADLGATVIKMERPGGEFMRHVGPFRRGEALPFMVLSHGRRLCCTLDLQDPVDRATAAGLAAAADVFVENWRPGTAARLGLGAAQLHPRNGDLVYVSASGFGPRGPLAAKGALDQISQAVSGLWSLSGADGGTPERFRGALLDYMSALVTAEGALVGLLARSRGIPEVAIEVSQLATALSAAEPEMAEPPARQGPRGSRSRHCCPSGAFCSADGVWLAVEAATDAEWEELVAALDDPQLADPRLATNAQRLREEDFVYAGLARLIARQPSELWAASPAARYLTPVSRPLGGVLDAGGLLRERDHVVLEQSRVGAVLRVRPPWDGPGFEQLGESAPEEGRDDSLVAALTVSIPTVAAAETRADR
ncbi:MAG: CoA transferase [Acidobacteriota bacterium]|nr:CoA transferase [Acidobacteriota bacterium]